MDQKALKPQEIASLTSAGFERTHYPKQDDLSFYTKRLQCKELGILKNSSGFGEIFLPDDIVEVEVIGTLRRVQLVVESTDYVVTDIEVDEETGSAILKDCGVLWP